MGRAFARLWKLEDIRHKDRIVLVPILPSKARDEVMFDPRMLQVLQATARNLRFHLDVRDCLGFSGRHGASHEADARPTPEQLFQDLSLDAGVRRRLFRQGLVDQGRIFWSESDSA